MMFGKHLTISHNVSQPSSSIMLRERLKDLMEEFKDNPLVKATMYLPQRGKPSKIRIFNMSLVRRKSHMESTVLEKIYLVRNTGRFSMAWAFLKLSASSRTKLRGILERRNEIESDFPYQLPDFYASGSQHIPGMRRWSGSSKLIPSREFWFYRNESPECESFFASSWLQESASCSWICTIPNTWHGIHFFFSHLCFPVKHVNQRDFHSQIHSFSTNLPVFSIKLERTEKSKKFFKESLKVNRNGCFGRI